MISLRSLSKTTADMEMMGFILASNGKHGKITGSSMLLLVILLKFNFAEVDYPWVFSCMVCGVVVPRR